jgi:hypothetical protein
VFYYIPMTDIHEDRIIIARLTGTARRHARHHMADVRATDLAHAGN